MSFHLRASQLALFFSPLFAAFHSDAAQDVQNGVSIRGNTVPSRSVQYTVSPTLGSGERKAYYLVKDGEGWRVEKEADIQKDGVEKLTVNWLTGLIQLEATPPKEISKFEADRLRNSKEPGNSWECYSGVASSKNREKNGYSICSSAFTKSVSGTGEAVIGNALNVLVGTVRNRVAIDKDKLLEVAETSGLLDTVEADKLARYRNTFEHAKTASDFAGWLKSYRGIYDPDGLLPLAESKMAVLKAAEDRGQFGDMPVKVIAGRTIKSLSVEALLREGQTPDKLYLSLTPKKFGLNAPALLSEILMQELEPKQGQTRVCRITLSKLALYGPDGSLVKVFFDGQKDRSATFFCNYQREAAPVEWKSKGYFIEATLADEVSGLQSFKVRYVLAPSTSRSNGKQVECQADEITRPVGAYSSLSFKVKVTCQNPSSKFASIDWRQLAIGFGDLVVTDPQQPAGDFPLYPATQATRELSVSIDKYRGPESAWYSSGTLSSVRVGPAAYSAPSVAVSDGYFRITTPASLSVLFPVKADDGKIIAGRWDGQLYVEAKPD